jgi:two-component sensor histidine kinase
MLACTERQSVPFGSDDVWLLLAEFNHRVSNELMAASAALRSAQRNLPEKSEPTGLIDQALLRLESFAQVHRLLGRDRTDKLSDRLDSLCDEIAQSKGKPLGIHIALSVDDVTVDEETAWTICVAASEFLTNACKYAVRKGGGAIVGVGLSQQQETVLLTVSDNGSGAEPSNAASTPGRRGRGLAIITQLASRLGGAVVSQSGPGGTTVTLRIPARPSRPPLNEGS